MNYTFDENDKRLYAVWNTLARIVNQFPFHRYGFSPTADRITADGREGSPYFVNVCGMVGIGIEPNNKFRVTDISLYQRIDDPRRFAIDFVKWIRERNPKPEYDLTSVTIMFASVERETFFVSVNQLDGRLVVLE